MDFVVTETQENIPNNVATESGSSITYNWWNLFTRYEDIRYGMLNMY